MHQRMPENIGAYRILARLNSGTETELFKAQHSKDTTGTAVCIKRVHPNLSDDPMFEKRFRSEIELAKKLRHRNIVEVSDFGEDDGHYFVMEYIDGPDLDELLDVGALSPSLVTYIGIEVCRALAFLHHTDISNDRDDAVVHSDVTPDNILIGRGDGSLRLSDFGLAKALGRTGAEVITRARGKLTYMSPEQLTPDQKIGSRSDLFSLGLVLWRALVGVHPYAEGYAKGRQRARSPMAFEEWIQKRTLENDRRLVAEAAPHAPPVLCAAIENLLQPVSSRTPTAEDVFNVLRRIEPLDGHAQLAALVAQVDRGQR